MNLKIDKDEPEFVQPIKQLDRHRGGSEVENGYKVSNLGMSKYRHKCLYLDTKFVENQ